MTRLDKLLEICKDLTEEHIIKACKNYSNELSALGGRDSNFIEYEGYYYKLKQTIRKANDRILNNPIKLDSPEYKKGGEYDFTANYFIKLFELKFGDSENIRLRKN